MTTATIEVTTRRSTARARVVSQPVTLARVLKSEWIKFRSLWSSWAVLGAAVLGMLIVGTIVAYNTRHLTGNQQPEDLAPSATLQGYLLGQLLIGALGVLFVSGEFGTGMIRSTFAAVPKRIPVLWAKLAVFSIVSAAAMTVTCIVTFVAAQGLIGHYRTGYSLSDPGVWRIVLGTALYLTAAGVIGGMVGWIVRSTPGSLVAYFALMLVLPLFGHLFGSAGAHVAQFLPSQAGQAFIVSAPESPHLGTGAGMLVVAAWVAAGVILAIVSLRRRDACRQDRDMRSEGGYVRPAVRRLLIDVLLAGGAALVAVLFDMFGPDYRGVGGLLWDLALAAPLALRRSAPATAAILVGAVCLAQWLTGGPVLGDLAVLIMVYSLAAWDRRRWLVAAALLVAGVGAVMAVERWGGREGEWLSALMMMGTVTAAAAIGLYVRTRRAYLASVIERAENAERDRDRQARIAVAEERARLAREMHDVVAHSLAVMITLNDAVVAVTPTGTVRDTAAQASDVGRQALGEMQRMLAVFRGAEPVDLVPQPGAAQLGDLIASVRSAGLPVDLTISGTAAELSPTTQLAIYRIVQESLTNVLKHARNVGRVLVTITYRTDRVQVRIRNDGEPVAARNGSPLGHGLVGMRQRSALYEGQFRAGPIPGGGWEVLADLSLLTPGLVQ